MAKTLAAACLGLMLATSAVAAQRGGGGGARGGTARAGGAPAGGSPSAIEQIDDRLDLDARTQAPAVERIWAEAARSAAPVAREMTELRHRLLELELTGASADNQPVVDAYRLAAGKMAVLEAHAYARVFESLTPKQQSKTPQAFPLMAGLLQPESPRAGRAGRGRGGALFETSAVAPQRGQVGGRGRGAPGGGASAPSRLETITTMFSLDKTQVKQVKLILDEASKSAAPIREQLTTTHAAIGVAIAARGSNVDDLARAYAVPATAMAQLEMHALAQVLGTVTDDQRANTMAADAVFVLVRGMFLDKKWDGVPNGRRY